jgi:hypothetical protein
VINSKAIFDVLKKIASRSSEIRRSDPLPPELLQPDTYVLNETDNKIVFLFLIVFIQLILKKKMIFSQNSPSTQVLDCSCLPCSVRLRHSWSSVGRSGFQHFCG